MEPQRIIGTAEAPQTSTILVVDDEAGIRALLEHWVSSLGYHVITAEGADEALEVMRSIPVHVAICDILMPHHDGYWLISELRREHPTTSIVIATGLDEMDPAVTLGSGIAAYIVKPFDPETFAITLKVALAMQTMLARDEGGSE